MYFICYRDTNGIDNEKNLYKIQLCHDIYVSLRKFGNKRLNFYLGFIK